MDLDLNVCETKTDMKCLERLSAHSHIHGLGVDMDTLQPREDGEGVVGQRRARRAAAIALKMAQEGKIAGRGMLLAGEQGTGKTAIAVGMAHALGENIPFTMASASEFFSFGVSKTEAIMQAVRNTINIELTEEVELMEGEVVEIVIEKEGALAEDRPGNGAIGTLTLRTTDMETLYQVGENLVAQLERERIRAGDVVSINKNTGRITKTGRSYSRVRDFDAVSSETVFVECPRGEVRKKKTTTQTVTLWDIDVINSQAHGANALFSGEIGEISREIRGDVDRKIEEWCVEGKAKVVPGILFIDEINMLDLECLSFLNTVLETENAPMLVAATNVSEAKIRGNEDETKFPYGLPPDFLDRLLITRTEQYSSEELEKIVRIRADEEDVSVSQSSFGKLAEIASKVSLRYAMHLMTVAGVISEQKRKKEIQPDDIEKAFSLFADKERIKTAD
ncbi:MAG: RuvB-like helicase 2 [Amphiamblys sp. WSBS2006]|nr:MAG: RuvB-like helicase 2 [Amphiamblys sp. WSBS2006]